MLMGSYISALDMLFCLPLDILASLLELHSPRTLFFVEVHAHAEVTVNSWLSIAEGKG